MCEFFQNENSSVNNIVLIGSLSRRLIYSNIIHTSSKFGEKILKRNHHALKRLYLPMYIK
jgi:DUF1009 family protein